MILKLENLTKRWGPVFGARDVNIEVQDGEFVALLGPSGCGKTTTLLMIAGIYKPTAGVIRFGDRIMNQVPPKDRNVGMVFQSYALYPHMTVYENLTFPMKLKKVPAKERQERAQQIAEMMGIGHLMDRRPGQLSGGQQQRVALGRALTKQPDLLLFDEPLSNLDARLRLSMRAEIKRLQVELGITSIYVTHDQVEAMTMADRIAVMRDGLLQAYCPPDELYDRPATLFVAGFVGNPPMNFLDVELIRVDGALHARCEGFDAIVPPERAAKLDGKRQVVLGIRPEDVSVAIDEPVSMEGESVTGEVYLVEPLGRDNLINIKVGDSIINVLTDPALGLRRGDPVSIMLNMEKSQFFDPETERSLLWP